MRVCYEIERDEYHNYIIWQITPTKRRYMKISPWSMAWLHQQIDDALQEQKRHDSLRDKMNRAQVSKAQKMADFLYGGGDADHSN